MESVLLGNTYIHHFGFWTTGAQRPQTRIIDNGIWRPGLWGIEIWSPGLWDNDIWSQGLWDNESAIIPCTGLVNCIRG